MKGALCLFLLSACMLTLAACGPAAPSEDVIQTAITQTQAAVPTATERTPHVLTPFPTRTRQPTSTPRPTVTPRPTQPGTTYIVEMGFCILSVSEGEVTGNPAEVPGCVVIRRTQETLMAGQSLEMAMDNQGGSVQIYCAIFSLDGTFIMADIDTAGSGKVTCP